MNFITQVLNTLSVSKENGIIILSRSRIWSTKGTVLEQCCFLGFTSSSNAKKTGKASQVRVYVHCYLEKWYNLTFLGKYAEGYLHFNVIVNAFDDKIHMEPYRYMGSAGLHPSKLREWNKVLAKPLYSFWIRWLWRLGSALLRQQFHPASKKANWPIWETRGGSVLFQSLGKSWIF